MLRLNECRFIYKVSSSHPVNDVLKTTSPTWVPEAPNDFAFQIDPSSNISLAPEVFQGLSPLPIFQYKKKKCINFFKLHEKVQSVFHFKKREEAGVTSYQQSI